MLKSKFRFHSFITDTVLFQWGDGTRWRVLLRERHLLSDWICFLNWVLPISAPVGRPKTHLLKPSYTHSVHLNSSNRLPSFFFVFLHAGSLRGKQVTGVALLRIIWIVPWWLLYLKTVTFEPVIVCWRYKVKGLIVDMMSYFDVRSDNLLLPLVISRVDRISNFFFVDFRFLSCELLLACSIRSNEVLRWEYGWSVIRLEHFLRGQCLCFWEPNIVFPL